MSNLDRPGTPNLTTYEKAFAINMDAGKYGTFAEIGAGQEVARWFFHVGGAAGTVAKTISAYDMTISDAVYGPSDRYVSRRRLGAMLDHEWQLLLERLDAKRGEKSQFFVFAETVTTRSYSHKDDGQGWLGIRLQDHPRAASSQVMLHVRLLDAENERQQEALGILGVNLIYGAFFQASDPVKLIASLRDGLALKRIEIDMIRFSGPSFTGVDNRYMALQLVAQGFTDATMFTADGEVIQPAEALYKKPVLVERGTFRPMTKLTMRLLERSQAMFLSQLGAAGDEAPVVLMEMTLKSLTSGDHIDHADFLARVDILGALGKTVMISNYFRFYPVVGYLRRFTTKPIVFAAGVPAMEEVMDAKYYADLGGGVLQALGLLFQEGVRMYVYPYRDPDTGTIITADCLPVPAGNRRLYDYLLEHHLVMPIEGVPNDDLDTLPRDVLAQIQSGDPDWELQVPPEGVRMIKEHGLFGYRPARGESKAE